MFSLPRRKPYVSKPIPCRKTRAARRQDRVPTEDGCPSTYAARSSLTAWPGIDMLKESQGGCGSGTVLGVVLSLYQSQSGKGASYADTRPLSSNRQHLSSRAWYRQLPIRQLVEKTGERIGKLMVSNGVAPGTSRRPAAYLGMHSTAHNCNTDASI